MIQFNQQYIRDYLKPFIQEVLTDMSTTMDKGDPLYKIRHQIQISAEDKEEFKKKYFQGVQPANRPFTGPDEESYQEFFIDELKKKVDGMIRLSRIEGMEQALLPDPESGRIFGTHQVLTRNLNRLAITMARNFEKRKIEQKLAKEGELNEENKRRVENGEVKLVEVDGEEQIKTEEQIVEMARKEPQAVIIPSIEPEIETMFNELPLDDKGAEKPEPPQKKSVTVTKVRDDFDAAKIQSVRDILLESGLEVVGEMTIENGVVAGVVRDVEGQELKVSVDTKKPNYAADKFIFIFTANGPHPELKDKRIPLSQNDLRSSFTGKAGERKPAEKVFKEQDEKGTMAREKYQPPLKTDGTMKFPETKTPLPTQPGAQLGIPPKGQPTAGLIEDEAGQIQGKIPTGSTKIGVVGPLPTPPTIARTSKAHIRKSVSESRIKGPQPVGKTIMEKKKKMKEQRVATEEVQQQRGPLRTPEQQQVPVAQPQKKRGMPGFAKLAIATGSGGIGLIFGGSWLAAHSQVNNPELVMKVILSCLGMSCIV